MRRHSRSTGSPPGFTLVELLVAMALIVLVMAILSAAFSIGLTSFSELKSIGDMSESLRTASSRMRLDLAANHLEDATGSPVPVSSLPLGATGWTSPNRGYFSITQRSIGYREDDGTD